MSDAPLTPTPVTNSGLPSTIKSLIAAALTWYIGSKTGGASGVPDVSAITNILAPVIGGAGTMMGGTGINVIDNLISSITGGKMPVTGAAPAADMSIELQNAYDTIKKIKGVIAENEKPA
jgi:hypothetical protein